MKQLRQIQECQGNLLGLGVGLCLPNWGQDVKEGHFREKPFTALFFLSLFLLWTDFLSFTDYYFMGCEQVKQILRVDMEEKNCNISSNHHQQFRFIEEHIPKYSFNTISLFLAVTWQGYSLAQEEPLLQGAWDWAGAPVKTEILGHIPWIFDLVILHGFASWISQCTFWPSASNQLWVFKESTVVSC